MYVTMEFTDSASPPVREESAFNHQILAGLVSP